MVGDVPQQRPSMMAVLGDGVSRGGCGGGALRDLKWRQKYAAAEIYPLELADGRVLKLRQKMRAELEGVGTGGTVWPAAYVLARYMELRRTDFEGRSVIELGAGTGAVGLVAAALGASTVALTDLDSVLWLARENVAANKFESVVVVAELGWGPQAREQANALNGGYFDFVLVSECVLPQLYPLEPLVETLDAVLGPLGVCLVAYEHRVFPAYDPRVRFRDLLASCGIVLRNIPTTELDPAFCSTDIEIWELSRRGVLLEEAGGLKVLDWGPSTWRFSLDGAELTFEAETACIGDRPWPSSLALARLLVDLPPMSVLELGCGCGFLASVLAKRGHRVIATDTARVIPILKANLERNKFCDVEVLEYAWGSEQHTVLPPDVDLVICSDCCYDSSAVQPLIAALKAVLFSNGRKPVFLIANEHRTALDTFLTALRNSDFPIEIKALPASESLWRIECLPPSAQPPPVALFASSSFDLLSTKTR